MKYKVDKNVPVTKQKGGPRAAAWPWTNLTVGDSIFFPGDHRQTQRILSQAHYWANKHNRRVISRRVIEDGIEGIRIWCTE